MMSPNLRLEFFNNKKFGNEIRGKITNPEAIPFKMGRGRDRGMGGFKKLIRIISREDRRKGDCYDISPY